MKKLVEFEDMIIAFISALGWGIAYSVSKVYDQPEGICVLIALVTGIVINKLGIFVFYSKRMADNRRKKSFVILCLVLVFLLLTAVFEDLFFSSFWSDFITELLWNGVIVSCIGFVITTIVNMIKTYRIRLRHKDGSQGYVMSEKELEYIDDLKGSNKEINKKYDKALAVRTENGIFVGKRTGRVEEFLGIPYAKAPINELRWKPPVKPDPSDKVWEAYYCC